MAEEGMFDLAEVCPAWTGSRASFVEKSLRRGYELIRERMVTAGAVLIEYRVEFDYDGPLDQISCIEPFATYEEAALEIASLRQIALQRALAEHPTWQIVDRPVLGANVMPCTRSTTKERFPEQVGGASAGNDALYEKLYLRYYVLSASDGELFDQLVSNHGLQDALISYLIDLRSAVTMTSQASR